MMKSKTICRRDGIFYFKQITPSVRKRNLSGLKGNPLGDR